MDSRAYYNQRNYTQGSALQHQQISGYSIPHLSNETSDQIGPNQFNGHAASYVSPYGQKPYAPVAMDAKSPPALMNRPTSTSKQKVDQSIPELSGFRIVTPGRDSREMLVWEVDRKYSDLPIETISYPSERWFEYRAWAQTLMHGISIGSASDIVVCTRNIISLANQGLERSGSHHRKHHAEENLLLHSRSAHRAETLYSHPDGTTEPVLEVNLEVSCVLLGIEPCFGRHYPGHECRDFFTPRGRLFAPYGRQDILKVLGRFVPRRHQGITPIFCFQVQPLKPHSLGDLLTKFAPIREVFSSINILTEHKKNDAWREHVAEAFGPRFEQKQGGILSLTADGWVVDESSEEMHQFLVRSGYTLVNGIIIPAGAKDIHPSRVFLDTVSVGDDRNAEVQCPSLKPRKKKDEEELRNKGRRRIPSFGLHGRPPWT